MPAHELALLLRIAGSNMRRAVRTQNAGTAISFLPCNSNRACITPLAQPLRCGFMRLSAQSVSPHGEPHNRVLFALTTGLRAVRSAIYEHRTTGWISTLLMPVLVQPPFRVPLQQLSPSVCRSLQRSRTCLLSASGWSRPTCLAWRYRVLWSFFYALAPFQQPKRLSTDFLAHVLICYHSIAAIWRHSAAMDCLKCRAWGTPHNSPSPPSLTTSNQPETSSPALQRTDYGGTSFLVVGRCARPLPAASRVLCSLISAEVTSCLTASQETDDRRDH